MNKHLTYLAVAAIASVSAMGLSSCKIVKVKHNTETITRQLDLKDFDKIEVNGAYELEYSQGPYSVTLIIPKEVERNVVAGVSDSLLKVEDTRHGKLNSRTHKITARISAPNLSLLRINGAGDVDIENIQSPNLYVESNGASKIDISDSRIIEGTVSINGAGEVSMEKIQGETLTVNVNGAGKIDVEGVYQHAYINMSGASFADITGLKCNDLHTQSNGPSKIEK